MVGSANTGTRRVTGPIDVRMFLAPLGSSPVGGLVVIVGWHVARDTGFSRTLHEEGAESGHPSRRHGEYLCETDEQVVQRVVIFSSSEGALRGVGLRMKTCAVECVVRDANMHRGTMLTTHLARPTIMTTPDPATLRDHKYADRGGQ